MGSNGNTPHTQCSAGGSTTASKPDCFESDEQWAEYQYIWRLSYRYSKFVPKVNICRDCTPEHRDAMIEEGRCAHPETVFIIANEGLTGVNGKSQDWKAAIAGRWPVVSQPDKRDRDEFLYREWAGSE